MNNNSTIFGYFLVNPNQNIMYIPIHKNAHSKFKNNFTKFGWQLTQRVSIDEWKKYKKFCILRDPYERYLSGFYQYMRDSSIINALVLNHLFDKSIIYSLFKIVFTNRSNWNFDVHTSLQTSFLDSNISLSDITFFYLNNRIGHQISKYLYSLNCILPIDNSIENNSTSIVYSNIKSFFMDPENATYKENLMQYLQPDYELIESVDFYAR